MAGISYQQTDGGNSSGLYCSGIGCAGSACAGYANGGFNLLASVGGTAGTTVQTATLTSSQTNVGGTGWVLTPAAGVTWGSGTWTIRLDVTTANSSITWASCYICRLDVNFNSQATIGSNTSVATALGTTGVKTATVTGAAQTPVTGDRVGIIMGFTNSASMSSNSFSFKSDQLIDSPLTASSTFIAVQPLVVSQALKAGAFY